MSSIITGLMFTLIVTRQLTPNEFGTWGLINGIFIYALAVHPVISYWATREIARGDDSGRSVFVFSNIFSIIGLVVYIIFSIYISHESDANLDLILFAAILIPAMFINESLTALNLGHKPQNISFGFLAFEMTKVPLGFLLVYFLQMGLSGAIIATLGAYVSSILIMWIKSRSLLQGKVKIKFVKKWLKLFWIPTFRNIPSLLSMSDVIVFSLITGSVSGVAYYTAAKTVGFLVNHTRAFSEALYPKLLESEEKEYLGKNLEKFFYFSLPLVAISIVFSKPALFALNPIYTIAETVVIILAIRSLLTTLGKILFNAMQGIEKVDLNPNSTFKDYLKSKLIFYTTFQLIRNIIYFGSLVIILYLIHAEKSEIELVNYWAMIGLIIEIPLVLYIIKLTKQNFNLNVNWKSLLKYLFSTIIVFSILHIIMSKFLIYDESIFNFLPQLLIFIIMGALGYLGMTYVIDKDTKILIKGIINELKSKGNRN